MGCFAPGYEFDAVAVDDAAWRWESDDIEKRFQKMIYTARSENVIAKYVSGKRIFCAGDLDRQI